MVSAAANSASPEELLLLKRKTYYIKVDEFRYGCFYMDFVFILFSLYDHILKLDQVVSFFNRIPSIPCNISGLCFLAFWCIS